MKGHHSGKLEQAGLRVDVVVSDDLMKMHHLNKAFRTPTQAGRADCYCSRTLK